jgi:hypothetical protein
MQTTRSNKVGGRRSRQIGKPRQSKWNTRNDTTQANSPRLRRAWAEHGLDASDLVLGYSLTVAMGLAACYGVDSPSASLRTFGGFRDFETGATVTPEQAGRVFPGFRGKLAIWTDGSRELVAVDTDDDVLNSEHNDPSNHRAMLQSWADYAAYGAN